MESTTQTTSSNACAVCYSQKRKCDKTLPSCSRCIKQMTWPRTSLSDFELLFCVPATPFQSWLPGSSQSVPTHFNNITSRQLDLDRYFVGLVMTALGGQSVVLHKILSEYFSHIHPWIPVIIESNFRIRLSRLRQSPCADTAMLLLAVFLVVSMKSHGDPKPNVYQIAKHLFSYLQIHRELSLELVQGGLLLTLYELGTSLVHQASISIANCARLGYIQRLNLDDGVNQHDFIKWSEAEERRRVWCGLYMLDRLIHQVTTGFAAPHAVEEPSETFRMPVDDSLLKNWSGPAEDHSSFATPAEVSLCYFAREIQGARILGPIQRLRQSTDTDWSSDQSAMLDYTLMYYMEKLIAQTPGSWAVLCGANGIGLASGILLHQDRLDRGTRGLVSSEEAQASYLALSSFVTAVNDVCFKFDAMESTRKIPWVPLPAVICAGEAAIASKYLINLFDGGFEHDDEPLRRVLGYATRTWKLADDYLRRLDWNRSPSLSSVAPQ